MGFRLWAAALIAGTGCLEGSYVVWRKDMQLLGERERGDRLYRECIKLQAQVDALSEYRGASALNTQLS